MTRKELITSREFWVGLVHQRLWAVNVEKDSDKYEKMADKVVDEYFMKHIKELNMKETTNPEGN